MSERWPGGIISGTAPVPSGSYATSTAPGVWTLEQQAYWARLGQWPIPGNFPPNIEDVFSIDLYRGLGDTQSIINNINLGSGNNQISLVGLTITNLGGSFDSSFPMKNINDGGVEVSNAQNIGYVASPAFFDVYVDMTVATTMVGVNIAPQGTRDSISYNTPTDFIIKASNDASTWATIATFTSVSTGYPNWNPGNFRNFTFSNSTAYRYWRFQSTSSGSNGAGVAISELRFTSAGTTTGNKGGMVWTKGRNTATSNVLFDTSRGAGYGLFSNATSSQSLAADSLTSFNANGFTLGIDINGRSNADTYNYAAWTFAKQAKFFDVVTWTGNGSTPRTITHNLGSTPGMIIFKRLDIAQSWWVFHQSAPGGFNGYGSLNNTSAWISSGSGIGSVGSTSFTITDSYYNLNGASWVAYLFAHNAGGFGLTGTDNVISCGSFTTDGSGNFSVNLGYEPQYVLMKRTDSTGNWFVWDVMRGMSYAQTEYLLPNTSGAAFSVTPGILAPNATGFNSLTSFSAGVSYIYVAIRRPMRTPTLGTQVFQTTSYAGNGLSPYRVPPNKTFNSDWVMTWDRTNGAVGSGSSYSSPDITRLLGFGDNPPYLRTNSSIAEEPNVITTTYNNYSYEYSVSGNSGNLNSPGVNYISWNFARAPGFFDVVAYTGTGTTTTQTHNLGVVPELMIFKGRSLSINWFVYGNITASDFSRLILNQTGSGITYGYADGAGLTAQPTSSLLNLGSASATNGSGNTYVAYLFATLAGISKVGSYTGTGATQTINCGFTGGARWVMIKRTDSTGDWWVWDTVRGMVAGSDERIAINQTSSILNNNWVYTIATGFQIVTTDASVNASDGSYIFLAIA